MGKRRVTAQYCSATRRMDTRRYSQTEEASADE